LGCTCGDFAVGAHGLAQAPERHDDVGGGLGDFRAERSLRSADALVDAGRYGLAQCEQRVLPRRLAGQRRHGFPDQAVSIEHAVEPQQWRIPVRIARVLQVQDHVGVGRAARELELQQQHRLLGGVHRYAVARRRPVLLEECEARSVHVLDRGDVEPAGITRVARAERLIAQIADESDHRGFRR